MKPFRNAWVSGALAVIAVLVVVYQVYQPRFVRGHLAPVVTPTVVPALPEANPAPAVSNLKSNQFTPDRPVDRDLAEARMTEWVASPGRDPFLFIEPPKPATAGAGSKPIASPIPRWKLKGIWLQAGARLAFINDKIYGEGDVLDGYTVKLIEAEQVIFEGNGTKERLGFNSPYQNPVAAKKK